MNRNDSEHRGPSSRIAQGTSGGGLSIARRPVRWTPRWTGDARAFVDELVGWLISAGRQPEPTGGTWLEHALETAERAHGDGAREELVVASLLCDVGTLLAARIDAAGDSLQAHEHLGAAWLARFFPAAVAEPVRLHVTAGRWLLATEPGFAATLRAGALDQLEAGGGPLPREAHPAFEADAHAAQALALYRWHAEESKPTRRPAPLDSYRSSLVRTVRALR